MTKPKAKRRTRKAKPALAAAAIPDPDILVTADAPDLAAWPHYEAPRPPTLHTVDIPAHALTRR